MGVASRGVVCVAGEIREARVGLASRGCGCVYKMVQFMMGVVCIAGETRRGNITGAGK